MDILIPAATIAIVIGLVQGYKIAGGPSRLAPFVALVFGIGLALLTTIPYDLRQIILQGIISGLSAAGLYSGTKAVTQPDPASSKPLA